MFSSKLRRLEYALRRAKENEDNQLPDALRVFHDQ